MAANNYSACLEEKTLTQPAITGSIPGVPHIFGIVWICIIVCLIFRIKYVKIV